MTPKAVRRSLRSDARANHAALLEAAASLTARAGLELPYDEIAMAAGVSRATVYRHFPTRQALSRALLEAMLERWEASVAELPSGPAGFEGLFDAWVRLQREETPWMDLLARSASQEDLVCARRRFQASLTEPTRAAREAGLVSESVSAREVRITLTMLAAALRPSAPPSEQRRAVQLARRMLFDPRRTRPG